jgi:hypothetical protein
MLVNQDLLIKYEFQKKEVRNFPKSSKNLNIFMITFLKFGRFSKKNPKCYFDSCLGHFFNKMVNIVQCLPFYFLLVTFCILSQTNHFDTYKELLSKIWP